MPPTSHEIHSASAVSPQQDTSRVESASSYERVASPLPENTCMPLCFCFKKDDDRKAALIVLAAVLYYFSIGLTSISLALLINERIAGRAEHPNSSSVLVYTTVVFIHSTCSFIFGRYTSGLGDYLGRKPMLVISSLVAILTRYLYYSSTSPPMFYVAATLSGALDLYYFTSLAWICDLFREGPQRSKRVGIFSGTVGGLTLTIAAPLGAILAKYVSPGFPFLIAPLLSLLCAVVLVVMPVDDTLGVHKTTEEAFYVTSSRSLPARASVYLAEHFPISPGSLAIIRRARHPLDWLTNLLMHITTSVMLVMFIQYMLAVFHWSGPVASGAVLFVGLCLGVCAPILLHHFDPVPFAFYAMFAFTVGLSLLAAAGTGVGRVQALGVLGVICLGLGISWVPALQSNITSQYGPDVQGVVSGMLGQQNDFSVWPSYVLSLGFTFSLKRDEAFYWPGSTFAAAAVIGVTCLILHYYIYGLEALVLTRRARSKETPVGSKRLEADTLGILSHMDDCDEVSTTDNLEMTAP